MPHVFRCDNSLDNIRFAEDRRNRRQMESREKAGELVLDRTPNYFGILLSSIIFTKISIISARKKNLP